VKYCEPWLESSDQKRAILIARSKVSFGLLHKTLEDLMNLPKRKCPAVSCGRYRSDGYLIDRPSRYVL
jgi:hypothetical protein